MSTTHPLRASDADRHRFIATLAGHTTAGRLSLDEYADRVDQVWRARTQSDLAALLQDLPPEPDPPTVDRTADGRHLILALLLALLVLLVLGVAIAAFR